MTIQLEQLVNNLQGYKHTAVTAHTGTGAAVAVVLRVRANNVVQQADCYISVKQFMDESWVKSNDCIVEVLYIKRAENPKDNWSGDVAFPGGRKEKDEELLDTAIRETIEEIGLDLTNKKKYAFLGRLDDMKASNRIPFVAPFVFLQLCRETPSFKLEPSEVAACRWIPLSFFIGRKPQETRTRTWKYLTGLITYPKHIVALGSLLKIDQLTFPAYKLPFTEDIGSKSTGPLDFILWGITMRISLLVVSLGSRSAIPSLRFTTHSPVMDSVLRLNDSYETYSKWIQPRFKNIVAFVLFIIVMVAYIKSQLK